MKRERLQGCPQDGCGEDEDPVPVARDGGRDPADSEELVHDAVDQFLDELHAGLSPDVEEFIAWYPECADRLRPLLRTLVLCFRALRKPSC